jgi:hypothetical protein
LPVIPATWEAEAGRLRFGDSLDKFSVSNKRTGGTAQVVDTCLASVSPSTTKKKKKRRKER